MKRPIVRLRQAGRVAVEGEDGQPLIGILSDPDRIMLYPMQFQARTKAPWLSAFRDDRNVRMDIEQRVKFAIQGHVAVPRDNPHGLVGIKNNASLAWSTAFIISASFDILPNIISKDNKDDRDHTLNCDRYRSRSAGIAIRKAGIYP